MPLSENPCCLDERRSEDQDLLDRWVPPIDKLIARHLAGQIDLRLSEYGYETWKKFFENPNANEEIKAIAAKKMEETEEEYINGLD